MTGVKSSLRGLVLGVALALSAGCSHPELDPPPPALSSGLPSAPPGALGARAASHLTPLPTDPTDESPGVPPSPFLQHPPGVPGAPSGHGQAEAGPGVAL